jgi:hypothetical protein
MGRFDALTQLEDNQPPVQKPAIASVATTVHPSSAPPVEKPMVKKVPGKKALPSAKPQPRRRAKLSLAPALPDSELVEKYTTHVEPSLVKKVQIEAIEQGINDYDVVRIALKEYFEKNR